MTIANGSEQQRVPKTILIQECAKNTWKPCLGGAADKSEKKRKEPLHVLVLVGDCWMKPVSQKISGNKVAVENASIAAKVRGDHAARLKNVREHVKKNCPKTCSQFASGTGTSGFAKRVQQQRRKEHRKERVRRSIRHRQAKGPRSPKRSN